MSVFAEFIQNSVTDLHIPETPEHISTYIKPETKIGETSAGQDILFGNDTWDMRAYANHKKSQVIFHFEFYSDKILRDEIKTITYYRMFYGDKPTRQITAIYPPLYSSLWNYCITNDISLTEYFSSIDFDKTISSASTLSKAELGNLIRIIRELRQLRIRNPEFTLGPDSDDLQNKLEELARMPGAHITPSTQTAVIPSRIYSAIALGLETMLDEFNTVGKSIIRLGESLMVSPGKTVKQKQEYIVKGKADAQSFEQMSHACGLTDYFVNKGITNFKDLGAHLTVIQTAAKLYIHYLTGMRDMEVSHMPFDCVRSLESSGEQVTILLSKTSKLTGSGNQNSFWVSIPAVNRAVEAAQSIARYVALRNEHTIDNKTPLFVAMNKRQIHEENKTGGHSFEIRKVLPNSIFDVLLEIPDVDLREEDLLELRAFESMGHGFHDKYKAGEKWTLATHQFRRSLAVYAARSGLLSVPAMAAQFKHLNTAMTSYYRAGSPLAIDLLELAKDPECRASQDKLLIELDAQERIAQIINYEERVLAAEGKLFGGAGKNIEKNGKNTLVLNDRENIKKQIKQGRLAFKESPIGLCTRTTACDKISVTNLTACVGCDKSILDKSSVTKINEHIIRLQEHRSAYKEGTPFFLQYTQEINKLQKAIPTSYSQNEGDSN